MTRNQQIKAGRFRPVFYLWRFKDLPLTLVRIALFSSKKSHGVFIFNVLRAIYDGNDFALGTNGLTGTDVLDDFFDVAFRRIPIAPDLNPNFVVRHRTSFPAESLPELKLSEPICVRV